MRVTGHEFAGLWRFVRLSIAELLRGAVQPPFWLLRAIAGFADAVDPYRPESFWRPREWLPRLWERGHAPDQTEPPR